MIAVDAASHYLWDNWLSYYHGDALLHRFSLAAPRAVTPEERHLNAAIHHWTSTDGATWSYRGVAVDRGPAGGFDSQAVWSGCAVDLGRCLALFYTGVQQGDGRRQTICAAFSEDGLRFTKQPFPILDPGGEELGYDLGDEEGVGMAWRDPFVFQDPDSGAWHMIFSAKRPRPLPKGCFGHAIALDDQLHRWELRPPIDLPTSYVQMECPAMLSHQGQWYCFASTKDRGVDLESEANAAIRAWRAESLGGPWKPAGSDGQDVILDHNHHLYAASFVRLPGAGDQVFATGFFSQSHARAYTWAPLVPVLWTGGARPRLVLPHESDAAGDSARHPG